MVKSTNYEAPDYVVFSSLLLLIFSYWCHVTYAVDITTLYKARNKQLPPLDSNIFLRSVLKTFSVCALTFWCLQRQSEL